MYSDITFYSLCRVLLPDCTVIGPVSHINLEPDVRRAIHKMFKINVESASVFCRASANGETYYSKSYRRAKVRNSYTIEYLDGHTSKLGFILV